jgi:hypothetical protein
MLATSLVRIVIELCHKSPRDKIFLKHAKELPDSTKKKSSFNFLKMNPLSLSNRQK